jgi:lysophospholipase L1-like esterase
MSKKLLFIGDSITEAFNTEKHLREFTTENKGVSGDTSSDVLHRLNENWFNSNPDHIFICIGTNDFAQGYSDETILKNITQIVNFCKDNSPFSHIHLITVFPTRHNKPRPIKRIKAFNEKLKELSQDLEIGFFDIYEEFTDESERLALNYTYDGLHLTGDAYSKWAGLIHDLVKLF